MNILVTGSSGYIGTLLCKCLSMIGYSVTEFDLKRSLHEDILNTEYLESILIKNKIGVVFHLAAMRSIDECENSLHACVDINLNASKAIYDLCQKNSIKLIFSSTHAVTHFKQNKYATCKALAEKHMSNAVIIRLCNVVGGSDSNSLHKFPSLTDNIISAISGGKSLILYGNCKRNFVFINDVVDFFIKAIDLNSGIYTCSGNINTDMKNWINMFEQYFNRTIDMNFKNKKPHDADDLNLINSFDYLYFEKIADSYGISR